MKMNLQSTPRNAKIVRAASIQNVAMMGFVIMAEIVDVIISPLNANVDIL
jgi:hypothetical protein